MPPADAPLTVTQLNQRLKGMLAPLPPMRVTGEISGLSPQPSGHVYFDLKDAESKIRITIWRSAAATLRVRLRNGMQVVCTGKPDIYVQAGSLSFNCTHLEEAGEGLRWAALQRLKEKLQAEGLFDEARKKPLPFLPNCVGLVTSGTGAAVQDMLRILRERAQVRVLVVPVKVQGEGSAESIAQGIELADQSGLCDVILCGRGGGSIEDLWAFNEERVVRAFAACQTPIVSAVGHETDTLLSDFAADWRAPTPTAAAERAVPKFADLQAATANLRMRAEKGLRRQLRQDRSLLQQLRARLGGGDNLTGPRQLHLEESQRRLVRAAQRAVEARRRKLEGLARRLQAADPVRQLAQRRRKLDALMLRLPAAMRQLLQRRRQRVTQDTKVLQALSPRAALGRGYGIVRRPDGAALASVRGVQLGEGLEILLADGELAVRVATVIENN